jgi:hypothetical protein
MIEASSAIQALSQGVRYGREEGGAHVGRRGEKEKGLAQNEQYNFSFTQKNQ